MKHTVKLRTILLLCWLTGAAALPAATWYVSLDGDDANGQTWATAYRTISNAVVRANTNMGDLVVVSNGEYVLSATISVTNGITVRGFNGRDFTTVNGNNAVRCFALSKTNAVLDGLTIANGTNTFAGGAYLNPGQAFNCAFVSNANGSHTGWGEGGGALMMNGACRVTNCQFIANRRSGCTYSTGSAVYMAGVGGVLADCNIISNVAQDYYAITVFLADGCNGVVTGCVFAFNTNNDGNGGVLKTYVGMTSTIANCVFSNNAGLVERTVVLASGPADVLTNCTLIGNSGGGVTMGSGTTVTDCRFIGNTLTGAHGSAASMSGGLLRNCLIAGNTNLSGNRAGAVYMTGGRMEECEVSGNAGPNAPDPGGGGIYMTAGVVSNCSITNNTARYAGGVSLTGGTLADSVIQCNTSVYHYGGVNCGNATVRNCLIARNWVVNWDGGGVYANNNATLQSCTIVSNVIGRNGGGIYVSGTNNAVQNCIIYSNAAAGLGNNLYLTTSDQSNLFSFCCTPVIFTNTANSNITNQPAFRDFAGGNFRLGSSSPCVNAGSNQDWMIGTVDLLGRRTRIYYGRVDIGCYEYFLDVKVNGIPIDRIIRLNGVDKNRVFRIDQ